jgi:hypothetical protein
MDRDDYADMFRYRLGDVVQYAEYPGRKHYVLQRRWTQRAILAPVVHYKLSLSDKDEHTIGWVREPDLAPWQETA